MLMRCATASVYFYTVVVLVRNFVKNSLYKCTSQPVIAKSSLIGVNTTGKVVSSACYDMQQVCVYLQPFSRYYEPIVVK